MNSLRLSILALVVCAPVLAWAEEPARRSFSIDAQTFAETANDATPASAEFPSGSTTETLSIALPAAEDEDEQR